MTRKAVLAAIHAAGTMNDTKAMIRLYVENRISLAAAREKFEEGRRWAKFVAARDAAAGTEH
jgi:hypothetical protein